MHPTGANPYGGPLLRGKVGGRGQEEEKVGPQRDYFGGKRGGPLEEKGFAHNLHPLLLLFLLLPVGPQRVCLPVGGFFLLLLQVGPFGAHLFT